MNRSNILKILKRYKKENAEKYGILTLGLFGTFSRGDGGNQSDVDIVIEISEPDIYKLVYIKDDLKNLLQRDVDIVRYRERMNPYLKKQIDKNAVYV
jgi:predicted nucleotidyltransferase